MSPRASDECYPPEEIEETERELRDAKTDFWAAGLATAGGIAAEQPLIVASGAAGMIGAGNRILDSKKDLKRMVEHNTKVTPREDIRDQRALGF